MTDAAWWKITSLDSFFWKMRGLLVLFLFPSPAEESWSIEFECSLVNITSTEKRLPFVYKCSRIKLLLYKKHFVLSVNLKWFHIMEHLGLFKILLSTCWDGCCGTVALGLNQQMAGAKYKLWAYSSWVLSRDCQTTSTGNRCSTAKWVTCSWEPHSFPHSLCCQNSNLSQHVRSLEIIQSSGFPKNSSGQLSCPASIETVKPLTIEECT